MAISQAVCNVFKQELLKGNHDFDGGATYYIALYTSSASLGATTTAYSSSNEVSNSSGSAYSAGGKALTSPTVTGGSGTATSAFCLGGYSTATVGTVEASKAIVVDGNKDFTGARNITITGELDAATLDISGDVDIDGTLEADAITVNAVSYTHLTLPTKRIV